MSTCVMMKFISLFLLLLVPAALGQDAGKLHPWTDLKGRTLQAKFIKADGASVTIDWNGKRLDLPLNTLSPESKALALKLGGGSPFGSSPSSGYSPSGSCSCSTSCGAASGSFPLCAALNFFSILL